MRQHKIYVEGSSDTRKSPITGGGDKYIELTIYVGTSSRHSIEIGKVHVGCVNRNPSILEFTLQPVKGKRIEFNLNSKEFRTLKI